ncbi:hypothetical protein L7F22_027660 [Adiantum nelumboides]|nr:hypothetical protein [Adiantum nelumboides]
MKFLTSSLVAAALVASSTLVAASPQDVSGLALNHGSAHLEKRTSCKAGSSKHKKHKSKKNSASSATKSAGSKAAKSSGTSSSSSASSSASSSSSSSGAQGSGKKPNGYKSKAGLCWANAGGINIEPFMSGTVSWFYSWGAWPKWDSAPTDSLFFPMLWGDSGPGANLDDFKKRVLNDQNGKWNKHKAVMAMNEVNQKGQAKMTPEHACSLMRENIKPLADKGWYVMGPSTTSAPDGLEWYKEFKSKCADQFNSLDAISLHFYDTTAEKFKTYVQNWIDTFDKDVWITEMACTNFNGNDQPSASDVKSFMTETKQWMDSNDRVMGYAWFAALQSMQGVTQQNCLLSGKEPNALFRMYSN